MLRFWCKKEEKTNFLFFGFVFFLWLSMACQAMNFNVPVVSALCYSVLQSVILTLTLLTKPLLWFNLLCLLNRLQVNTLSLLFFDKPKSLK